MAIGAFNSSGLGTAILTVRGSGLVQETSGNFFVTDQSTAAVTGIVNLVSGGTIAANKIFASGGTKIDD